VEFLNAVRRKPVGVDQKDAVRSWAVHVFVGAKKRRTGSHCETETRVRSEFSYNIRKQQGNAPRAGVEKMIIKINGQVCPPLKSLIFRRKTESLLPGKGGSRKTTSASFWKKHRRVTTRGLRPSQAFPGMIKERPHNP